MYRYNRRCTCDRCRSHILLWPVVLVTLGVLFLADQFGNWHFEFGHTWPVLLIVVGGVMLLKRNASMENHVDPAQDYVVVQPPAQPAVQPPTSEVHNG